MDAVKQFLLAQGGDIRTAFLGEHAAGQMIGEGVMEPFELIIELPREGFVAMVNISAGSVQARCVPRLKIQPTGS